MKYYAQEIAMTVVLGLLLAFVVYCIAFAPTRASTVQAAREASVKVVLKQGHGSGVVITGDGRIITAGHVCADEETLSVETYAGKTYQAEILWIAGQADLCLIRAIGGEWHPVALATAPAVGAEAFHVGHYLPGLVSFGTIGAETTGWDERAALSYIGVAGPGSSGGGVFNMLGELIGLVYSGPEIVIPVMDRMGGAGNVRIPRGLAYVVPASDIAYLLVR